MSQRFTRLSYLYNVSVVGFENNFAHRFARLQQSEAFLHIAETHDCYGRDSRATIFDEEIHGIVEHLCGTRNTGAKRADNVDGVK